MRTGIVVIAPDPAEDDPLGMLKIPEDHAVLIAGMANGSEGLDYGTLPCKVREDPGAVLRALAGVDDDTDRIGTFPERILGCVAAEPGRH